MLLYAALAGMMMGIFGMLAVQFLWDKVSKVFIEVAEPEVAAQIAITDVEEKEDLTETPEEPEPERTRDARPGWDRVYVTPFGKKWHRRVLCQGLVSARRVEPITRQRAQDGGYVHCRYCSQIE